MKKAFKRGFTLVELLVVVLIIGILSSVALPQYTKAVKKARGVKVTTAAGALVNAVNMAYLEDGSYRRWFSSYTNAIENSSGMEGADNFDIEIPKVSGFPGFLGFSYSGEGGHSATVIVDLEFTDADFHLVYHLSNGKLNSITCSGPGCRQYFPGSMLSNN